MAIDAAMAEAGRRRLRPVLMTTCTTILALGIGEGADAQALIPVRSTPGCAAGGRGAVDGVRRGI